MPQIEHPTNGSETTHAQVTTNNRQQHNHPPTHRKRQIQWMWVPKNQPVLPSPASHTQRQKRKIWKWVPKTLSTNPFLPSITTKQRWVCKDLLLAQGYYKGNAQLWIPKMNQLQAVVFRSTNPRDKGKLVLQSPPPSPTTCLAHPLDTPSTFFEIGESSNTSTTKTLDIHSMVHAIAPSHPIPTLEPQPPTTTPVTPQLSMVTLLFKRHVQTSKGWLNKLSRINKPPTTQNHISVFMAETEMEEDLLYQFRN